MTFELTSTNAKMLSYSPRRELHGEEDHTHLGEPRLGPQAQCQHGQRHQADEDPAKQIAHHQHLGHGNILFNTVTLHASHLRLQSDESADGTAGLAAGTGFQEPPHKDKGDDDRRHFVIDTYWRHHAVRLVIAA